MADLWERREDETARSYAAFTVYRNMGPTRTLKKTARQFYELSESAEEIPRTSAKLRQLHHWSAENMWVARCEAYDAEMAHREALELEEYRRAMNRRHRNIASTVQAKLVNFLNSTNGDDLTWQQVSQVLNAASQLERLAAGEATGLISHNHQGEVTQRHELSSSPEARAAYRAYIRATRGSMDESDGPGLPG